MLQYLGFLTMFVTTAASISWAMFRCKSEPHSLPMKHVYVALYSVLSALFYFATRQLLSETNEIDPGLLLQPTFQVALAIQGASFLILSATMLWVDKTFNKILLGGVIYAAGLIWVLRYVGFGIINSVWVFIFAGAFSGFLLLSSLFHSLEEVMAQLDAVTDLEERRDILSLVRDEMNRFLKIGLQSFLALAASLGVSMSILFGGGAETWDQFDNFWRGVSMVAAISTIGLGLGVWVIRPYLESFVKVRYFYERTLGRKRLIL